MRCLTKRRFLAAFEMFPGFHLKAWILRFAQDDGPWESLCETLIGFLAVLVFFVAKLPGCFSVRA